MHLSPADALYFPIHIKDTGLTAPDWCVGLLNYFVADFVILNIEDTAWAYRIIFAFGTDLLRINEHGDVLHDNVNCFSHRFFQRPGDSS